MLVLDRFDGDVELYFKKTEHDGNEVHRELSECEPPTGCPSLAAVQALAAAPWTSPTSSAGHDARRAHARTSERTPH